MFYIFKDHSILTTSTHQIDLYVDFWLIWDHSTSYAIHLVDTPPPDHDSE